jgi:hypothetical protein
MAYRGEDLDLRTPQGWGPASREAYAPASEAAAQPNWWTRSTIYHGGRADPIWIDDTVMACCNRAYDLAIAHRAAEVRIEHLLHAMTLVEPAAAILDERGVGVVALRRESGAIITGDIPIGTSNGGGPRKSAELEEALRLAADRAYPRRTPVTVDDVLVTIFEMTRDRPGVQLLYRHAAQWTPPPEVRERVRVAAGSHYTGDSIRHFRGAAGEGLPVARFLPTSERVLDERVARGEEVGDRLGAVERNLEHRLDELQRMASTAADRMLALEEAATKPHASAIPDEMAARLEHLAGLDGKLDAVELKLAKVLDRLVGLEKLIDAHPATVDLSALDARLQSLEDKAGEAGLKLNVVAEALPAVGSAIEQRVSELALSLSSALPGSLTQQLADLGGGAGKLDGHVSELKQAVAAAGAQAADSISDNARSLSDVHEALLKLNANQQTIAASVDQWRLDAAGDLGVISNRIEALERGQSRPVQMLDTLSTQLQALIRPAPAAQPPREVRAGGRNRFLVWLFGTDEVWSAGWRPRLTAAAKAPNQR